MQFFFKLTWLIFLFIILISCSKNPESLTNVTEDHMVDIDGNVYQTVKIGNQVWMKENLRVTHYRNGDEIPNVLNDSSWINLTTGAYCTYDNDDSNISIYGLLYNWHAVGDTRNIAPEGWHVPTDQEGKELEMYLGLSRNEADDKSWRGTDEGSKLKATSGWNNDGNGTNISGFSALPNGYRYGYTGAFSNIGSDGYCWSASQSGSLYAWFRNLSYSTSQVRRSSSNRRSGSGVRCVRDQAIDQSNNKANKMFNTGLNRWSMNFRI